MNKFKLKKSPGPSGHKNNVEGSSWSWSALQLNAKSISFSFQPTVNKLQNMWDPELECGFSEFLILALVDGILPHWSGVVVLGPE